MMTIEREDLELRSEAGVVVARQAARAHAARAGLNLVSQTKLVTAVSELARNMVVYGGGGQVGIEQVEDRGRRGVRVTFQDQGPGIPDLERAMQDGFTTGRGLGQGLPGSRRLVNEFEIASSPGRGTRVVVIQWAH